MRGYSRASNLELSSNGTRWYIGFGWSRSSNSSEGKALSVGVSIALGDGGGQEEEKKHETRGGDSLRIMDVL